MTRVRRMDLDVPACETGVRFVDFRSGDLLRGIIHFADREMVRVDHSAVLRARLRAGLAVILRDDVEPVAARPGAVGCYAPLRGAAEVDLVDRKALLSARLSGAGLVDVAADDVLGLALRVVA